MKAPVFVTGLPRCGTSWAGQVLGNSSGFRYLYEPLNHAWVRSLRGALPHFTYLAADHQPSAVITKAADRAFAGHQGLRQLARAARRGYWRAATRSPQGMLIKDPTACLMADWIAARYRARVLVIFRHPCGFASSMARLGWKLNMARVLTQAHLMQDHLAPFDPVLRAAAGDPWQCLGAYWAAVVTVLRRQLQANPRWLECRYETLCANPAEHFRTLAEQLGLELLHRKPRSTPPGSSGAHPASTRRDSRSMAYAWQKRLSAGQIDAVLGVVQAFGLPYDTA